MEPQVRRDLSGRSRSLVRSRDWGMAGPSSIHRPAPGGPGEAVTVPQAPPPRPRSREGTFSEGVPECQRGVPREDRGSFRVGPGKVPPRATQSLPAPCSPCARTATGSPPAAPTWTQSLCAHSHGAPPAPSRPTCMQQAPHGAAFYQPSIVLAPSIVAHVPLAKPLTVGDLIPSVGRETGAPYQ